MHRTLNRILLLNLKITIRIFLFKMFESQKAVAGSRLKHQLPDSNRNQLISVGIFCVKKPTWLFALISLNEIQILYHRNMHFHQLNITTIQNILYSVKMAQYPVTYNTEIHLVDSDFDSERSSMHSDFRERMIEEELMANRIDMFS